MKRKFWILTVMLCLIASLCGALVGCGGGKKSTDFVAEFKKDIVTEVYLSKDIDLDDYIVKVKDADDYKVTVEYYNPASEKVVSETFSGYNMVFYPKIVGEHTIIYSVTVSGTTKTASATISVISDPPTITISHTAQTIPMPDSGKVIRSYELLMSNASMLLKPVTATTEVVAASYRAVSVGLDSGSMQWEKEELEDGSETFTFTKIGEYQFYVRATSGDSFAEDYFLVNVIKDPSEGTQKSDGTKVVETGKGVVYAENDPYTFKIMSSTLSDINYAVVADELGEGKKLSLVFKGKNVPQLGFYVIPDEGSENPYNIKTTKGGFFSFVAKESSGHKWVFFFPNMLTGNAARTPVPGKNDFGVDDLESDKYYLMQYSLGVLNFNDSLNSQQLKVNVEIFEAVSFTTEGENSVCTVGEKLYEIGAEGAFWFEKGTGKTFDFSQGRSVIYGDIRNNIDIQYIPNEKNILKTPKKEVLADGTENVYLYKSTVQSNADGSLTADLKQGKIIDDKETGITDQLGYVGIINSGFGMGTTITLDFEGKNLPGVGIYLDDSPEGYAIGGATASGTGFYIGNGNVSGELKSIGQRLIVNGPNRLDPGGTYRGDSGYPPYFGRIDKLSYFGTAAEGSSDYNRSALMGYNLLEDGKKYRFEITDVSASDGDDFSKFVLNYKLYDMSTGTPVLIEEATKSIDRNFDTINFKSQTIAFFGSIHQDIKFTYSLSGERTDYPYETEIDPDAVTLKSASITEIKENGAVVGFEGSYDYLGLGEYKAGDVLEFRFTGKNIPNVGLFVNKNGVNAIGGGTENTGIFLQTSGHGASAYNKRLYITGPFLLDAGGEEYYKTVSGLENFEYRAWVGANKELAVDISYTDKTSLFGIDMLDSRTEYVYRVWTEAGSSASTVKIYTELYSADGETKTLVASFSKEITHYLDSLENRYAVVYGAGSYSGKDISFTYTVNPEGEITPPIENDTPTEGELTLNVATVTEVKENGAVVGFEGNYDYRGLGEYKVGDVLEFRFTGKNIPNVGLFVNKNGVNAIGGGTANEGIFLQTSGHGTATFSKRLYIAGPFLADAGSVEAYRTVTGLESYEYKGELGKNKELGVATNAFGIDLLDDNTEYIYRIWTAAGSDGTKAVINIALYSTAGNKTTLIASFSKEITHCLGSLENRYAVVYGAGDYYGRSISFAYTVNPEYEITPTEGELTLNAATVTEVKENGAVVGFGGNYDYRGLGEYKVGDVLEFRFTGKNIPNVGLFVNKNGVNAIGGGTENTGIFLQTSGHGTATFSKRLYIAGPFLADAGSVEAYRTVTGLESYEYKGELGKNKELGVATNAFGIDLLDDNTEYIYRIWTEAGSSEATVKIYVELYSVDGETKTLIASFSKEITHYLDSLENRYAVVYGAGDYYGQSISFTYEINPDD